MPASIRLFGLGPFDAVVFDCDGVMVDSEPASVVGWMRAMVEVGHPVSEAEVASFVGKTERDLAEHFGPLAGVDPAEMEQIAKRTFLEHVERDGLQPFDDAVALIDHLGAAAVPLAAGSNSFRWRLDAVLRGAGIADRIPLSVSSDEVPRPKPAPDVYRRVSDLMGIDPGRAVVVEDTPTGIAAARAAGFSVVAVDRGMVDRRLLESADTVVDDLRPS